MKPGHLAKFSVYSFLILLVYGTSSINPNLIADSRYQNSKTISPDLTPDERNNINVFNRTNKSVVFVTNAQIRRDYFSMNVQEMPVGSGTGFVWDKSGLIVTNYHVIENANKVIITLWDQSTWNAKMVGGDPNKDLAVLRIDAPSSKLFPINLGNSNELEVGRKVLAIGNPFGLDTTLTVGVISALGREINIEGKTLKGLIQTDAAINRGNSGGPLLNSQGELIGVNTVIISPTGVSAGVGFAIPVNTVKKWLPQLIKYGRIMRPIIGINILDDSIARRYGIKGVVILRVPSGTPANRAGLVGIQRDGRGNIILGDIIIKIDEHVIHNQDDLYTALEQYKPGDKVWLKTIRGNETKRFSLRLSSPGR